MRYALVNPNWTFEGSVYFGCREPHFPLELGYSLEILQNAGHEAILVDGHMEALSKHEIAESVSGFSPDFIVIPTAPTYLFWRCPPPEVSVPKELLNLFKSSGAKTVLVGPHGSVTPMAVMKKLEPDIVVMGEPEFVLPELALPDAPGCVKSICYSDGSAVKVQGGPRAAQMADLPAIRWPERYLRSHAHHHHRFGTAQTGLGAEVEASRGCPYSCSFCAKREFRTNYRKRALPALLDEIDWLISNGVEYLYFIDEIFMPDRKLLEALSSRPVKFGIQTRIDLWKPEMIAMLGSAGCVSIETGIESVTEHGRNALGKKCTATTGEIINTLITAKRSVPFVQATLLDSHLDDPEMVEAWRDCLLESGVWVNKPVPLFPYPGSDEYSRKWGEPDESAWERAHEYYLEVNRSFSDIQESSPLSLNELEGK